MLWLEHANGAGAMESQLHDVMVESLTIDNVPIQQSARLEDYSPELWALTGAKGAAVMNMLRHVVGDEKFFRLLKTYLEQNAWKSANTEEFSEGRADGLGAGPGILLHPVDRIERRARIQARVHRFPYAEGLPRDGQNRAGSRHLPHAGRS